MKTFTLILTVFFLLGPDCLPQETIAYCCNNPGVSPDGTQLAFNSEWSVGQPIEVYLINTDGSNLNRLTRSKVNTRSITPVWIPLQASGRNDQPDPLPNNFQLNRNYSNPFSVSTTIEYSVSRTSHIQLIIMDITGKRIATLVEEIKAPGLYSEKPLQIGHSFHDTCKLMEFGHD